MNNSRLYVDYITRGDNVRGLVKCVIDFSLGCLHFFLYLSTLMKRNVPRYMFQ